MRRSKRGKKTKGEEQHVFRLGVDTKKQLRQRFLQSLDDMNEYAGNFVLDGCHLLMDGQDEEAGSHGQGWTGVNADGESRFTWHTHPIMYEEGAAETSPLNRGSSMLPSGEDLMGCVQDSLLLKNADGFLGNPKGNNVFDVIATAPGLLLLGAGQPIVDVWLEMARFDDSNKRNWCKRYGVRMRKNDSLDTLKRKVERRAFAEVENSYNFDAFKEYCGAFGFLEEGLFADLEERFGNAGYYLWWPDDRIPQDELTDWDTSEPDTRALAVKLVQHRWFKSNCFLAADVAGEDPDVIDLVQYLRDQGFVCSFCNWDLSKETVFTI